MLRIRALDTSELGALREIERDAGRAFAEIGMKEIAEDEPPTVDELLTFVLADRAWVAVDARDIPVAYLLGAVIDGAAHVEQVSVARASGGQGIGAALIDHLGRRSAREGRRCMTLTTFRDVPWNAPYYERLGFTPLRPGQAGPELVGLLRLEAERIPGDFARVAMRRPL